MEYIRKRVITIFVHDIIEYIIICYIVNYAGTNDMSKLSVTNGMRITCKLQD